MAENLTAFLAQNAIKVENEKFVASERFVGKDGKPIAWEICCITAAENAELRKQCMRQELVAGGRRGQKAATFDANKYQALVGARCTVFPNLNDAELQDSYGVKSAEELLGVMLKPGEFEDYTAKVLEVNGFTEDIRDAVDEAKN